jgi:opacity protein-like surface antigen
MRKTLMRNTLLILGLALLLGTLASAQEYPKSEVYTGFTYIRVAPSNHVNAFNAVGGLGSFQYNINEAFGIVAEFGGITNGNISGFGRNFPGDQTQFSYLFGPRVTYDKTGKFEPFVELLFGGAHNSRSFSVPNTAIPLNPVIPRGITVEPGATHTKFRSTQNAFAMAFGGGLDIAVKHGLAVRPFEIDYFPTHFSPFNFSTSGLPQVNPQVFPGFNTTQWQHNIRVSLGVAFRFGGGDVGK